MKKTVFRVLPYIQVLVIAGFGILLLLYGWLGWENGFVQFMNGRIFNGRVGLAYAALQIYPTTLFGIDIDLSIAQRQLGYFALDNGQVCMLLLYGVVGFAAYSFITQIALNCIAVKKKYVYAIVAMIMMIWTLWEATIYDATINFTLLFATIFTQNDIHNHKKGYL